MRGAAWEAALDAQHRDYRRDRRAVLLRCHPRRDRDGRYLEPGPPDYVGVLAGGRAVAADAKEATGRLPCSQVADHQARDLEAVWLAGGLAGILLRLDGVSWWVDWGALREVWQPWRLGGRPASVGASWLAEHGRRFDGADWLTCHETSPIVTTGGAAGGAERS